MSTTYKHDCITRRKVIKTSALLGLGAVGLATGCNSYSDSTTASTSVVQTSTMLLPGPDYTNSMSTEEALQNRRSRRIYTDELLTIEELGQLLWAAQGVTSPYGFRTAPSAGGLYPLEVYVVVGEEGVEGLAAGVYRYLPGEHRFDLVATGDLREELCHASVNQIYVADAPVDIVLTAVYSRTTGKYGERGIRYVHMEAGHAAQNVYLQAEALGLGTVVIGAFDDSRVRGLLDTGEDETPLYVMPVGRR